MTIEVEFEEVYGGGSAGRVDATRGSKHRGFEQPCSLRGDCT
jgi:hypothetical protein